MHLARRRIGGWEEFKGLPYSPYFPLPYFPYSQKVAYLLEKELMMMLGLEATILWLVFSQVWRTHTDRVEIHRNTQNLVREALANFFLLRFLQII